MGSQSHHTFSSLERDSLYKTIYKRRDVRGQFLTEPIPIPVLSRILLAAHHAPSVGFMQPWNFIVIRSPIVKQRVHAVFRKAHSEAVAMFDGQRRKTCSALKLEGILESPVNICITCDRERAGPVVLGRTHIPETDLYSSVCAVQNLWLSARAEGLGVGWVSIFNEDELKAVLEIEERIVPVAYLCIGYVSHFQTKPELENANWRPRLPLDELIYFDEWNRSEAQGENDALL